MATLTTVVSRIDMIAPSTTTLAIASSLRSSPSVGSAGDDIGVLGLQVHDRKEHAVDELLEKLTVERFAGDQRVAEDHGAGDVREERRGHGGDLAAGQRPRQQHVVAAALVGD